MLVNINSSYLKLIELKHDIWYLLFNIGIISYCVLHYKQIALVS